MYAARSPLQTRPLSRERFSFLSRPSVFRYAAFAGSPGPTFFFSAFLLPVRSPSCVEGLAFSHPDSPSSRIRSQLAHTGPAGLVWGFAGIVSLTWLSKSHTGPHRVEFVFSPKNELTPPPKGGGAGYCLSRVCWFFHAEKPGAFPQEKTDTSYPRASLGSCLGNCWSQTGHAVPTGPVWGFGGVVPYPAFKIAHRAAQG